MIDLVNRQIESTSLLSFDVWCIHACMVRQLTRLLLLKSVATLSGIDEKIPFMRPIQAYQSMEGRHVLIQLQRVNSFEISTLARITSKLTLPPTDV